MRKLIVAAVFLLACLPAFAQLSQGTAFTYQGQLSQAGAPIDGDVDLVFSLFDAPSGGNQVGPMLEFTSHNGNPIVAHDGVFDATLDFGTLAFNGLTTDQRFLEVSVNGTLLSPRTPIENAPYALQSRTSELAYTVSNGAIGSAQIDASQVQRRIGSSCASGSSIRSVNADGSVTCEDAGSGTITGVTASNGISGGGSSGEVALVADTEFVQRRVTGSCVGGASISAIGAGGDVSCQPSGVGTITGVVAGDGLTGGGVSGNVSLAVASPVTLSSETGPLLSITNTNTSAAVSNAANFAITGPSSNGAAVFATSASNSNAIGVGAIHATETGVGGFAGTFEATNFSGAATALYATTNGNGAAVQAQSNGTGSAINALAFGSASSIYARKPASATGIVAQFENQNSSNASAAVSATSAGSGPGVSGNSTAGVGVSGAGSTGVVGSSSGATGYGVKGVDASNIGVFGSGTTGVRGESTSTSGFGMVGYNSAATGNGRGVYGQSDSASGHAIEGYSGPGIGIYGASSSGLAGYFSGNVQMNNFVQVWGNFDHEGNLATFQNQVWIYGLLSKPGGSFKIDDPIDPANKYLYHSFVESPDMKNIYDGIVTLDARGEAWVELPDYFEALNRDFRYQLTALSQSAPSLYIADEIIGNRFRIAGGNPGQRVSWQTTGTRHDAYAEANRIPNEVEKPADERGRYLYPELFGQPASTAIRPANTVGHAAHESPSAPLLPMPALPSESGE